MNHEKEHKQEALGEYKVIHPSLHLCLTVYASIMLYNNISAHNLCMPEKN